MRYSQEQFLSFLPVLLIVFLVGAASSIYIFFKRKKS